MKVLKKIGAAIVAIIIVLVLIASVCIIIANVSVDKEAGEVPNLFGYTIAAVQTDSMADTFYAGDLVIGKTVDSNTEIKVDDIISFYQKVDDTTIVNTHRVVDIVEDGAFTYYVTQGDNRDMCPEPDPTDKSISDVVSVYEGKISGVGKVLEFLKKPLGFLLCLVLPIVVLIIYEIYKLVTLYVANKKQQMVEDAKDGTSDEVKDAIIQEYLKKQSEQDKENKD